MKLSRFRNFSPSWRSAGLALMSAVLLILAYPGWELWFTAYFAFIPLLIAIGRERDSRLRSFITGWIFGTVFFIGTCWWLTFSPITYAGFPWLLAYFLLICVCLVVGIFPALFALAQSLLLRRLGSYAILFAPFIWTAAEFLRFWTTGNNWNAVAYSQAFSRWSLEYAAVGGIYLVGFIVLIYQTLVAFALVRNEEEIKGVRLQPIHLVVWETLTTAFPFLKKGLQKASEEVLAKDGVSQRAALLYIFLLIGAFAGWIGLSLWVGTPSVPRGPYDRLSSGGAGIIAVQPNVPMDGLNLAKYEDLKRRHALAAESAFSANLPKITDEMLTRNGYLISDRKTFEKIIAERFQQQPKIVIFPESPMNFMYEDDKDFQEWVRAFAVKNNASVLFNAAEPDPANKKYFNSAVMVDAAGNKIAQYDKIYLVPFGESVPSPLQGIIPALVGSFSYGKEYDLLPFGDARGGVMICFESHFPNLSREYVRQGADVLVEMTNDGYLGPTPILRQHLANAVFRAVETDRPVVRVTNVGITAYINERGEVIEPTNGYTEDTRVWSIDRSSGSKTFYVKYGDWFAWVCSIVTAILLAFALIRRIRAKARNLVDLKRPANAGGNL